MLKFQTQMIQIHIYIWDVDGIVIGRSDQLSDKEIDDLTQ